MLFRSSSRLRFFAALTATFGNLAAYPQTNLKRLLAYSTIAHAGYMMMGLAPLNPAGAKAVLFYLVAYLVMNLGAFALVAFLRNATGSEDLRDMRGLVYRAPWAVALLGLFLLSLLGLPPLAGFAAKFQIFYALFRSAGNYSDTAPGLSVVLYTTLVFGGINSVLSAVYYVKVMKTMISDERIEDIEGKEPVPLCEPVPAVIYAGVLAAGVFAAGLLWGPLNDASEKGSYSRATRHPDHAAQPGPVDCAGWPNRIGCPQARFLFCFRSLRPGSRPSRQLRRGRKPLSSGAHQIHGFQQNTVHPNEPSTPHL